MSARPPGSTDCPLWRRKLAARNVKSTAGVGSGNDHDADGCGQGPCASTAIRRAGKDARASRNAVLSAVGRVSGVFAFTCPVCSLGRLWLSACRCSGAGTLLDAGVQSSRRRSSPLTAARRRHIRMTMRTQNDDARRISLLTKNTLALVLAGGRGSRLHELTAWRAKPAIQPGGKFRIIDFHYQVRQLGIWRIGVLTQYKAPRSSTPLRGWTVSAPSSIRFVMSLPASQRTGDDWYTSAPPTRSTRTSTSSPPLHRNLCSCFPR